MLQIQAYRKEFLEYGGSMDGCGSLRRFDRTQDWLDQVEALMQAETTGGMYVTLSVCCCVCGIFIGKKLATVTG